MANSIKNDKDFRALLTRKGGATGAELQAFTGRSYVYSTWSLRTMETPERSLYTVKDGSETRYMLLTKTQEAAVIAKAANDAAKLAAVEAKAKAPAEKAAKPKAKIVVTKSADKTTIKAKKPAKVVANGNSEAANGTASIPA